MKRFWPVIKEFLEAASLVAVIVTMLFVGLQWKEMARQYKLMTEQIEDARKTADAAKLSTDRALAAAERQAAAMTTSIGPATMKAANAAQSDAESAKDLLNAARSQVNVAAIQAAALRSQAESVRREVDVMNAQAASMKVLADANKSIADAAGVSANAATAISDRALIQVNATIERPLAFVPLTAEDFDFIFLPTDVTDKKKRQRFGDPGSKVLANIMFTLANRGRSVANNIHLSWSVEWPKAGQVGGCRDYTSGWWMEPNDDAYSVCSVEAGWDVPEDLDRLAKSMCETGRISVLDTDESLFPAAKAEVHQARGMAIPLEAMEDSFRLSEKSVQLHIVGCVTYTFANATEPHRTWFTYRIGQRVLQNGAPSEVWRFEIGKIVPASQLFLRGMVGGNGAD